MSNVLSLPPVEVIEQWLSYQPDTGEFTWIRDRSHSVKAGCIAGRITRRGYRTIGFGGRSYFAHRIAWLLTYGAPPAGQIDHINGDKADNRIANLRAATASQNAYNRVGPPGKHSSLKGVTRHRNGRWQATIKSNGRDHYLGLFSTEMEAFAAYCSAAEKLHGEFARVA